MNYVSLDQLNIMTAEPVLNQRGNRVLGVKITGAAMDSQLFAEREILLCDVPVGDSYVSFAQMFADIWQKDKRWLDYIHGDVDDQQPLTHGELLLIVAGNYDKFPDILKRPPPTSIPTRRINQYYVRQKKTH